MFVGNRINGAIQKLEPEDPKQEELRLKQSITLLYVFRN